MHRDVCGYDMRAAECLILGRKFVDETKALGISTSHLSDREGTHRQMFLVFCYIILLSILLSNYFLISL